MKNYIPDTEEVINDALGMQLVDSYRFWSKRRLLFNIITGATGLLMLLPALMQIGVYEVFCVLLWGALLNVLYCLGYVCESYFVMNDKNRDINRVRTLLFWVGTITCVMVQLSVCISNY